MRDPLRRVVVAIAGTAVLGVASCGSLGRSTDPPKAAATPDDGETRRNPDPLTEDAMSFAEHLGVDVATAREYLARQTDVGQLGGYLRDHLDAFGGLYLDYEPDYAIVVLITTGDRRAVHEAVDASPYPELRSYIVVREVDWTEQTLSRTIGMIDELTPDVDKGMSSDLSTGFVHVQVETPSDADRIRAAIADADLPTPTERIVYEIGPFVGPEYEDEDGDETP